MHSLKQLGIEPTYKEAKANRTTEEECKQEWIRCGILNAHAIELLSEQFQQLSNEKKQFTLDILTSEEGETNQPSDWQRLITTILHSNAIKEMGEIADWTEYNETIDRLDLKKEELLGLSLYMAKAKNIEGAISGTLRLLKGKEIELNEDCSRICLEIIRFLSKGKAKSDQGTTSSEWIKEIQEHIDLVHIVSSIASLNLDSSETENLETHLVIIRYLERVYISHRGKPDQTNEHTWKILQNIAYRKTDPQLPELVLVESQSLPRSGHHYLKKLLNAATEGHFSYCESYQDPGCCKNNPCSVDSYWRYAINKNQRHYRLLKSHDFKLDNKTFNCMPGMFRMIQIREPFELLISWLELAQLGYNKKILKENDIDVSRIYLYHEKELLEASWETIDMFGRTMKSDEAEDWLLSKKQYIKSFLSKWIPISQPIREQNQYNCGNFMLHYKNLEDPKILLSLLGIKDFDISRLPVFRQSRKSVLTRKSKRVESLCQTHSRLIREICNEIKDSTPLLANGSNAWS